MPTSAKKESAASPKGTSKAQQAKADRDAVKAQAQHQRAAAVLAACEADEMIDRAKKYTVSDLFASLMNRKDFVHRVTKQRVAFDWTEIRQRFAARDAASPRWYVQIREEDLPLCPDGTDVEHVEVLVIAETSTPGLAPRHCVIKDRRCYSDIEDNGCETILDLGTGGLNFCWREITADDGSAINCYVLRDRAEASSGSAFASHTAAPSGAFSFGTSTGATTVGFGSSNSTAVGTGGSSTTPGFGFGSAMSTPPAAGFGFGTPAAAFGTPAAAPAAASVVGFGFGSGTTAPAAAATFGFGSGAAAPAAAIPASSMPSTVSQRPKVGDVQFALWTAKRMVQMAKEVKSGSLIKRPEFQVHPFRSKPAETSTITIKMTNDVEDDVDTTSNEIVAKFFAKRDKQMQELDAWIEACPIYNPKLADVMQKTRRDVLQERCHGSAEWADLEPMRQAVAAELSRIVALRQAEYATALVKIESIAAMLRDGLIAEKHDFVLRKLHPKKDDGLRFRTYAKIPGITEEGEFVAECFPAPFVVKADWH